jgi:hypothetical protein
MQLDSKEFELIKKLEEGLWISKTRFDMNWMEGVLATDFIEYGQSGRVYDRQQIFDIAPVELKVKMPLIAFQIKLLDTNTALVTYISQVNYPEGEKKALRSSMWSRYKRGWQLRFHQGTAIPHN